MDTVRTLLVHDYRPFSLSRMSDAGVIEELASLLVCGRLHVHTEPLPSMPIVTAAAGAAAVADPPSTPFPLAERKPRRPPHSAPARPPAEPPTLPAGLDHNAQAAALTAAAASGAPFCPP